jgi:hypothetical protein
MTDTSVTAELIKADTALNSFRDGGYTFEDMVGEYADNSVQSSATIFRVDWVLEQEGKKNSQQKAISIGIADNGNGIPPNLLPNCLTIGFGTRLNDRNGIGKYGVGFKLSTLSQAKRLTVYTIPRFLFAKKEDENGNAVWSYDEPNVEGHIFKAFLDLDEIISGNQKFYAVEECKEIPSEYVHLMKDNQGNAFVNGTLFVIEKLDRFNERKSFAEDIHKKFNDLAYFLGRAFRKYIDAGFRIYLAGDQENSIYPYDPTFQIESPFATKLAQGHPMEGEYVEAGDFQIDGHKVEWKVFLTPKITRMWQQGGGTDGEKKGDNQFKRLFIPDNEGKISFLRKGREVSYTIVPRFLPEGITPIDRYIGIEISFSPHLDEYFQVRHIKRGAEPVEKLRQKLRDEIKKPVLEARKRIRLFWIENTKSEFSDASESDVSGGRKAAQDTAKESDDILPKGVAGSTISVAEENEALRKLAAEQGIQDPKQQQQFVEKMKQFPIIAVERSWPGKGILDIEHLTNTVVVYLNHNHPFIQKVYSPLKKLVLKDELAPEFRTALSNALQGIDLLFFAYAKAENQSIDPDEQFSTLREDWGKFASHYLKKMQDVDVR